MEKGFSNIKVVKVVYASEKVAISNKGTLKILAGKIKERGCVYVDI